MRGRKMENITDKKTISNEMKRKLMSMEGINQKKVKMEASDDTTDEESEWTSDTDSNNSDVYEEDTITGVKGTKSKEYLDMLKAIEKGNSAAPLSGSDADSDKENNNDNDIEKVDMNENKMRADDTSSVDSDSSSSGSWSNSDAEDNTDMLKNAVLDFPNIESKRRYLKYISNETLAFIHRDIIIHANMFGGTVRFDLKAYSSTETTEMFSVGLFEDMFDIIIEKECEIK